MLLALRCERNAIDLGEFRRSPREGTSPETIPPPHIPFPLAVLRPKLRVTMEEPEERQVLDEAGRVAKSTPS
jgi:hypothetical protein